MIEAGITALRRRFCDDEHREGHEKAGSVAYANFHDACGDEDVFVQNQRYAAGLAQALLERISAKFEEDRSQT